MFRFSRAIRALVSLFHRPTDPFDEEDQWPELPCPTVDERDHDRWSVGHCEHATANQSDTVHQCGVTFVGGPLDGHVEDLPLAAEELSFVLAVPISPALVAKLDEYQSGFVMRHGDPKPKLTSVAFYERDVTQLLPPRFLFLGSTRSEDARSTWAF